MADVSLNLANFAPPSGYTLIKVSKVSWISQLSYKYCDLHFKRKKMQKRQSSFLPKKLLQKAFIITASLDQQINTSLTQIYHVQQSEAPNCSALSKFFLAHQAIAKRCHNCYKIQLNAKSLDELLMLHFLMKTLHLKDSNTSKCMIELRPDQHNF